MEVQGSLAPISIHRYPLAGAPRARGHSLLKDPFGLVCNHWRCSSREDLSRQLASLVPAPIPLYLPSQSSASFLPRFSPSPCFCRASSLHSQATHQQILLAQPSDSTHGLKPKLLPPGQTYFPSSDGQVALLPPWCPMMLLPQSPWTGFIPLCLLPDLICPLPLLKECLWTPHGHTIKCTNKCAIGKVSSY